VRFPVAVRDRLRILTPQISRPPVVVVHIELGDGKILGLALIRSLPRHRRQLTPATLRSRSRISRRRCIRARRGIIAARTRTAGTAGTRAPRASRIVKAVRIRRRPCARPILRRRRGRCSRSRLRCRDRRTRPIGRHLRNRFFSRKRKLLRRRRRSLRSWSRRARRCLHALRIDHTTRRIRLAVRLRALRPRNRLRPQRAHHHHPGCNSTYSHTFH